MKHFGVVFLLVSLTAISVFAQGPVVGQGGIVNGASFSLDQPDKRVAPGSLISIFGTNLASGPAMADSIPISTSLGDIESVTINGLDAPILAANPGQINVQLPWDVIPGTVNGPMPVPVVVTRKSNGSSMPVNANVAPYSPGIFTFPNGAGNALALDFQNKFEVAAPVGAIPGRTTQPAKPGDILEIFATGLGPVTTTPANGEPAPTAPHTTTTPVVMIGGVQAKVQFSGLTPQFVGLYQVNIVVPANAPTGNAVPLQIQIGGITSTNQATIAVAAQ
jgi:minor extracellular serine protease Vpr